MHMTVSRKGESFVQKWKPTVTRVAEERDPRVGAERDVLQAEDTDRDVGQRQVEPRGGALRRHVDERRVGEPVERDQSAQRVDERQRPEELDAAEHDVDLGLPGRPGVEADPSEDQLHQPGVAVADELQVEVDDLRDDVDRRWRSRRRPNLDVEAQGVRASA